MGDTNPNIFQNCITSAVSKFRSFSQKSHFWLERRTKIVKLESHFTGFRFKFGTSRVLSPFWWWYTIICYGWKLFRQTKTVSARLEPHIYSVISRGSFKYGRFDYDHKWWRNTRHRITVIIKYNLVDDDRKTFFYLKISIFRFRWII